MAFSRALIAFTMSIDDFVISYFTAGSSTQTLAEWRSAKVITIIEW